MTHPIEQAADAVERELADLAAALGVAVKALEKLASYNEDIAAGRINYRPHDHIAVARATLAQIKGDE